MFRSYSCLTLFQNTAEPRYNEDPEDWQTVFAITRFHYMEVLFHIYFTIPEEKKIVRYTEDFVINYRGSLHWGFTVWWRKIQSMIKGQGWLWCSNAEHSCLVFVWKKKWSVSAKNYADFYNEPLLSSQPLLSGHLPVP